MKRLRATRDAHWWALVVTLATFAILIVWWVGFYPGIATVDSEQAWDQARAWIFQDWHPVFHTWLIAILTRGWHTAGAVTLAQIAGAALVLGSLCRRLQRAGTGLRWSVGIPLAIALSPTTGSLSVVIWKDIPFAISVLWMFTEVFDVGTDPNRFFASKWRAARLGAAFAAVLLFRQNGVFVAGIVMVGLAIAFRRLWRKWLVAFAVAIGSYVLVTGPLYSYLDAWPTPALFTYTTFIHDMAAIVNRHADEMPAKDIEFLSQILPIDRWKAPNKITNPKGLYYCRQATGLIFPPEFYPKERLDRHGKLVPAQSLPRVLLQNPQSVFLEQHTSEFMDVWKRSVLHFPGTFLGHRFCVGSVAWSPWHKTNTEIFVPPRVSNTKNPDLMVRPMYTSVNHFLNRVLDSWNDGDRRWFTWRVGTWIYPSFLLCGWAAWRRRSWRYLVVALPGFSSWLSVVLFTPGQSGRYTFPAYLCAIASIGVLGVKHRPGLAGVGPTGGPGGPADGSDVPSSGPGPEGDVLAAEAEPELVGAGAGPTAVDAGGAGSAGPVADAGSPNAAPEANG